MKGALGRGCLRNAIHSLNEQQGEFPIDFRWMDGWMDVGQSVGEERRGEEIDSADERRGWGLGTDWGSCGSEEGES